MSFDTEAKYAYARNEIEPVIVGHLDGARSDGSVINASAVSSSDKAFEPSAVEAVNQWLFQPGQKDGNVVNTHMQVPIVYSINRLPKG